MRYLGENELFSYRGNICEPVSGAGFLAADAVRAGRSAASLFKRAAVGFSDEIHRHIFMAFSSGASESGAEVLMCGNTNISSFRYGIPVINADCGIYISGSSVPHFTFFGRDGFPLSRDLMKKIMELPLPDSTACGELVSVSALENIYSSFIRNAADTDSLPINAGISCGNRMIRSLWRSFFSDSDDSLIFQISDDCSRVNAYITEAGFVSYDRLIMAYSIMLWKNGETVYLPEDFHYIADNTASDKGYSLVRFSPEEGYPAEAVRQRFLGDPLYMCVRLAESREQFFSLLKEVPEFTSARRNVSSGLSCDGGTDRVFSEPDGLVRISQSGKGLLSLTVQSCDSETAAELCSVWSEKLRRMSLCSGFFQSGSKKNH